MPDYPYKDNALEGDEIRLLNLCSGDAQEELVANLEVVRLSAEDLPRYDTLSYTWGSEKPSEQIKIIQNNDQYRIKIRPNLFQALTHLRTHRDNRYLWIDAICINQSDEQEKSSQVRMMSQIFNNSRCVCVWVGPEKDDSRLAIDFIKSRLVQEDADQLLERPEFRYEWVALSKLMRRPWFSRRWIIQEIALAKTASLHCGTDWVPWETFAEAVMLFTWGQSRVYDNLRAAGDCSAGSLGDLRESAAARLIQAQDNIFRKSKDGQILEKLMSLEDLLCRFSASETLHPRDYIYALLSIARDAKAGSSALSTTYEDSPLEYFPEVWGKGLILTEPLGNSGQQIDGFPFYIEPYNNNSNQSLANMKRRLSNTDIQAPNGHARQIKRVQTDRTLGPGPEITIEDVHFTYPPAPPAIFVSNSSDEIVETSSNNNAGGQESFSPRAREQGPPTPTSSLREEGPMLSSQGSQGSQELRLVRNGDESTHNGDRPIDEQNTSLLQVPRRGRGDSSASISTTTTENYEQHTKGIRENLIREHEITIDYRRPESEVCKDVMRYAFSKTQSLNMICRPWAPRVAKDTPLPSWIQPVTKSAFGPASNGTYTRINADPLVGEPAPGQSFYNATPNVFAKWKIDQDGENVLTVHGFVLDEINRKAPPANGGVIPVEWNEIAEWDDVSTSPPPDAFWRTLVGNRGNHGQQPPKLWRRACRNAFGMKPRDGPLNVEKALEEASSFTKEYLEKVLRTTCSRRLSIGKKLLWALVPPKSKKGDKLCIINGCSVPVVLRPVPPCTATTTTTTTQGNDSAKNQQGECQTVGEDKSKTNPNGEGHKIYRMIGECYIHGMMDGEALLYQHKYEIPPCTFRIK